MSKMKAWKDAYREDWRDGENYDGSSEDLTSLEGAPSRVIGDFSVRRNLLRSLRGAPTHIHSRFNCSYNELDSLEGAPSFVGGVFICSSNKLKSLKDIHLQIKRIGGNVYFDGNPIKSHVLGLLLIDGIKNVWLDNKQVERIIDSHLPSKGMESVLLAQEELINAGFEEYAQL